jgi:hypothetical protein
MNAAHCPRERQLQLPTALGLGRGTQVAMVDREQIEGHELRGCLRRQLLDPRGGRVKAHLQSVEVEASPAHDHDLAVDHAARGQALAEGRFELREIAVQRLQVPALDVEAIAVAKHDGAEAVPLRLEQPALARG